MASIEFESTLKTDKFESAIVHTKKSVKDWAKDVEKSTDSIDKSFDKLATEISALKDLIVALNQQLKVTTDAFSKASTAGDSTARDLSSELSTLRKERDEAVQALNETAEAQKELTEGNIQEAESVQTLTQGIGDMIVKAGGATTIMYALLKALKDTTAGFDVFNIVGAVTKQVLNDIVTGTAISVARIREAVQIQKELNSLRKEALITDSSAKDLLTVYNYLLSEASNHTKSNTERIKLYDKALQVHNDAIDIQIENTRKLRDEYEKLYRMQGTESALKEFVRYNNESKSLEAERFSQTRDISRMKSELIQKDIKELEEWRKKLHDGLQKLLEEYTEKQEKEAGVLKELQNEIAANKLSGMDKELLQLKQKYEEDLKLYEDNEAIKAALGEKYAQDRYIVEMKYLDKVKDENTKLVNTLLKLDPGKGYSLLNRSLGGKGINIGKMGSLVGTNQTEAGIAKQREINLKKEKEIREEILAGAIQFTGELAGQLNLTQEQEEAVSSLLSITSQLAQGNFIGAAFSILSKVLSVFGQMGAVMREPEWKKQIEAWDDLIERQQRVIELSERTGGTEKALKDAVTLAQKELADINAAIMRERERRGTVPEDLLDARREAMASLQDAQQALTEFLTGGVNQIDIAGIIAQGFEDGKQSAKDFTDDFNELMRQAINNSLEQLSKPSITAWYQKFAADMESAGGLDDQEIIKLKEEWNAIVVAEKARRDQAYAIAGITDRAVQNEGLTGQIRREITEETGTELAGLFRRFADDQRVAKDYSIQGVNHLVGIEANTAETVNQLQLAITELQAINTNTKQVAVGAL